MFTPHIIKIGKMPHPKFEKQFFKSLENDPLGAFSITPHGVLHMEEVRAYIHINLEDYDHMKLGKLYLDELTTMDIVLKDEYKALRENKFDT